VTEKNGQTVRD